MEQNLGGGKTYTIALADKAAFLNRLKKQNIQVTSDDIQDDTLNKTFQLTLHSPESVQVADALLQQSKAIDDNPSTKIPPLDKHPKLQELKNLIKKELKEIVIQSKSSADMKFYREADKIRRGISAKYPDAKIIKVIDDYTPLAAVVYDNEKMEVTIGDHETYSVGTYHKGIDKKSDEYWETQKGVLFVKSDGNDINDVIEFINSHTSDEIIHYHDQPNINELIKFIPEIKIQPKMNKLSSQDMEQLDILLEEFGAGDDGFMLDEPMSIDYNLEDFDNPDDPISSSLKYFIKKYPGRVLLGNDGEDIGIKSAPSTPSNGFNIKVQVVGDEVTISIPYISAPREDDDIYYVGWFDNAGEYHPDIEHFDENGYSIEN